MFARISTIFSFLLVIAVTGLLLTQNAFGSGEGQGWKMGSHIVVVNGTDDWLPGIPSGEVYCSEGEIDMANPLMPACPAGSSLEIRNFAAQSAMYADDPRLAGLLTYVFNGSFNAYDFTGPAWGTFTLELGACDGVWEGTWTGQRSFVPGQANPMDPYLPPPGFGGVWISKLELRGSGAGECIGRLGMKGLEIITTLTPMPLPYEMLLPCDIVGCLPEGVSTAKILGPWHQ